MCSRDAEFINDDELLYRKIPVSQKLYDPLLQPQVSPEAFKPHSTRDGDGISLDRASSDRQPDFRTAEQAGFGPSPHGYYVAVVRFRDVRAQGIDVVPTPNEGNPGHASIPSLNSANRKSNDAENVKRALADSVIEVLGPFGTADPS